ncbi:MAG: hypothetical protein FOGNACKC_06226 [Anaerolineae bacterium]|nr:hypothetical protein [Anaerolineae bacterium]
MPDPLTMVEPYAAAVRKLLKGPVYHDDPAWTQIRDYELPVRDYLAKIGLSLHLDEIGNFAYLYDDSQDDDGKNMLPALTSRRNLSFIDTLTLVLLRERLDEHEMRDLDGSRLILAEEELAEMLSIFLDDQADERKVEQNLSNTINRLKRYGFLTSHSDGRFEVRPLLRAKISADEMDLIKTRLIDYLQQQNEADDDNGDDESV